MQAMDRGWLVLSLALVLVGLSAHAAVSAGEAVAVTEAEDTITLDLKDVDVRSAIEAIFRNTARNFSMDQNVQGTIPVLSFKNVPFKTALKNLTRSAGLVYREDGGIYIISKKPEVSNLPPREYNPPKIDYVEAPTTSETRIEKIPLNFTSASEILAVMSGGGRQYGGAYGTMGNSYGSPYGGGYGNYGRSGYSGYPGYGNSGRYGNYGSSYGNPGYGGYGGYTGSPYTMTRRSGNYGNYGNSGNYGNYGGYGYRGW